MKTIKRVQTQIENGNETAITIFLDKLEEKVTLPNDLQEKVDALGDTPIEEKKINKAIEKQQEDGVIPIIADLVSREDAGNYSAEVIGDFIHKVIQKVTSFKKEDGTYKSTPSTKECDMPNAFEVEDILKLLKKTDELRVKSIEADDSKQEKALEKYIKCSEDLQNKVFEIAGLDKEKLSDWEQLLVTDMTYATVRGFRNHAQGKRF